VPRHPCTTGAEQTPYLNSFKNLNDLNKLNNESVYHELAQALDMSIPDVDMSFLIQLLPISPARMLEISFLN